MSEGTKASIKLENITKRVNKLLQDKHHQSESQTVPQFYQQNIYQMVHKQEILEAYQKSEKMSLKLKQIRTLLGIQKQSSPKEIEFKKNGSQNKRQRVNLKKFVLSMRKRNQTMKSSANQSNCIAKQPKSFGNDDPGLQQYTDASLKYIKSFLPHQTLIDYNNIRYRKVYSQNANKQLHKKQIDSNILHQVQLKLIEKSEKYDFNPEKTPEKQINVNQIDFSPILPKRQTNGKVLHKNQLENRLQSLKDQTLHQYYTINVDSPSNTYMRQKFNSKRNSSPLQFLAVKKIQNSYKTKVKQRNTKIRQQSKLIRPEARQTIKIIVPVILPCIPKQRQFI